MKSISNTIRNPKLFGVIIAALILSLNSAFAAENIHNVYRSVRASGLGGVTLTTGQYDENFFGNPARLSADPNWKVGLPDPTIEINSSLMNFASALTGGKATSTDGIAKSLKDYSGKYIHARVETTFPSVFLPNFRGTKMSYAIGLLTSFSTDLGVLQQYSIDPQIVVDAAPTLLVSRKFLAAEELAVGVSMGVAYRLSSGKSFGLPDLFTGTSLSPKDNGGDGGHFDFGIGATYDLPWKLVGWDLASSFAFNNILGGAYTNLPLNLVNTGNKPREQPRKIGLGVAMKKPELWKFNSTVIALELQDIGNNTNGSLFRLLHLGAETKWKIISIRTGVNQGYLCAGLGFDLKALQLDFATFGEEMALNTGSFENRIYSLRLGFQI